MVLLSFTLTGLIKLILMASRLGTGAHLAKPQKTRSFTPCAWKTPRLPQIKEKSTVTCQCTDSRYVTTREAYHSLSTLGLWKLLQVTIHLHNQMVHPTCSKKMFPRYVSDNFSMTRTKVSYLISDRLGPYFRQKLCHDISHSGYGCTIQYDKTGNLQGCVTY